MNHKLKYLAACIVLSLAAVPCFSQSANTSEQFTEHVHKAQQFLSEKRPDLAIPELEAAVRLNPQAVDVQGNLGVLLFFQGKYAAAVPHLRAAVAADASLSKIQGLLGIAEEHTQDPADAVADLAAAFPHLQDKPFKVRVGLELVSLYTSGNDLNHAAAVLTQLQKTEPANPEVLYAAYRTYSELMAQSMLSLALVAPNSAQMHQMLAHEEIKRGDTNAAIAEFRKAIAINPDLPGVHFDLAELLKTSQNPKVKAEAEQEYRADLAQNPNDGRAERRLGEIDAEYGRAQQAYNEFSRAVQMQPNDADAKLDLAKILIQMGHDDKAMPLLEQAVQLDPTNPVAHLRLAQLYQRKGRQADAQHQVDLYKKYTQIKTKLEASYKELRVQPNEIELNGESEK
ncbi:MAG TPA: tetratricopeptide repeat protein [Acidobacteriaceae bacterium]|nr:tetratricopeptide repeat protein [Acidobacteriaceae bacterium]